VAGGMERGYQCNIFGLHAQGGCHIAMAHSSAVRLGSVSRAIFPELKRTARSVPVLPSDTSKRPTPVPPQLERKLLPAAWVRKLNAIHAEMARVAPALEESERCYPLAAARAGGAGSHGREDLPGRFQRGGRQLAEDCQGLRTRWCVYSAWVVGAWARVWLPLALMLETPLVLPTRLQLCMWQRRPSDWRGRESTRSRRWSDRSRDTSSRCRRRSAGPPLRTRAPPLRAPSTARCAGGRRGPRESWREE